MPDGQARALIGTTGRQDGQAPVTLGSERSAA
jgi:hypothetical protein